MKTNPKIFHGPENICGIGRSLADWQRKEKSVESDFIVFSDNTNRQNSHRNLDFGKKNHFLRIRNQIRFFIKSIQYYDIFHFYFGKSLLPLNLDLPILRIAGKKVLMSYVGSDIRLEKIEKRRNPYYHLRKPKKNIPDFLIRLRMVWHGIWCNYCFAEPKLAIFAQSGIPKKKIVDDIWITKTINIPTHKPKFLNNNNEPVIIHAPTNYLTKGTKFVQNAVDALHEEGLKFQFKIFHKVPHKKFLNIMINEADIVIDQLLSGGFGTLSMEGMTYGKPVCCYVTEDIRKKIPDLPIVQCTVETLRDNLRDLILQPEKREKIGRAGWEFAREHFDRDTIAEELWQIYMQLWNKS